MTALARSVHGDADPPLLRDVKVKITSRCNLRCSMCRYWKVRQETALATERWRALIDEMVTAGCRKIHFSGGEVFVREDFLDIVEHATSAGLKVNLTTNATLIDKVAARRLVKARVNSVSVSLDGPTAGHHDAVRGVDGAFRRSLRAIRWIQEYSAGSRRPVKIRINTVLMDDTFRQLPEMVQLAGELGAVDLCAMPVDEKGAGNRKLTRSQMERYNRTIADEVLALRRQHGLPTDTESVFPFGVTPEELRLSRDGLYARGLYQHLPCMAPWLHMYVAWDGAVYPCCMTNGRVDPLGHLDRQSVLEVLTGPAYAALRARFRVLDHLSECARCDLYLTENRLLNSAVRQHGRPSPETAPC